MKLGPCCNCKIRYPACHDECQVFITWCDENKMANENRAAEKHLSSQTYEIRQNRFRKSVKDRRKET